MSFQCHRLLPVEFLPRNPAGNVCQSAACPISLMSYMILSGINNNLWLWYCILCTDHLKEKQQKPEFWMERAISIKQIQYAWDSYLSWIMQFNHSEWFECISGSKLDCSSRQWWHQIELLLILAINSSSNYDNNNQQWHQKYEPALNNSKAIYCKWLAFIPPSWTFASNRNDQAVGKEHTKLVR